MKAARPAGSSHLAKPHFPSARPLFQSLASFPLANPLFRYSLQRLKSQSTAWLRQALTSPEFTKRLAPFATGSGKTVFHHAEEASHSFFAALACTASSDLGKKRHWILHDSPRQRERLATELELWGITALVLPDSPLDPENDLHEIQDPETAAEWFAILEILATSDSFTILLRPGNPQPIRPLRKIPPLKPLPPKTRHRPRPHRVFRNPQQARLRAPPHRHRPRPLRHPRRHPRSLPLPVPPPPPPRILRYRTRIPPRVRHQHPSLHPQARGNQPPPHRAPRRSHHRRLPIRGRHRHRNRRGSLQTAQQPQLPESPKTPASKSPKRETEEDFTLAAYASPLGTFDAGDFILDELRRESFFRQLNDWQRDQTGP